jgi:2-polyprenyl-3-methyl-5-hydroxy-6-metoxy-1,4-benzoquinol methylase
MNTINEKVQQIIDRAMSDRSVYDEMARKEASHWGSFLVTRERSQAQEEDQAAAAALRLHRDEFSLVKWARMNNRVFQSGLSIGCGEGRAERRMLAGGICRRFHGIDVAEDALAEARKKAKNLPLTYEAVDINFAELPERKYDLVVAQTCLHHVLHLENAAEQIWRTLQPGGILWLHDYIGETQFQYTDERLAIVNRILAILPAKYRNNRLFQRVLKPVVRPEPGRIASPFESIRSAEIVPVFERWFDIVEKRETTSLHHLVMPNGTRAAYVETEEGRALFEIILLLDQLCLKHGILSPTAGQYVMAPKPTPDSSSAPQPIT